MGILGKFFADKDVKTTARDLTEQHAYAVPSSNRALWSGGLVAGLTPSKLSMILDAVRQGGVPAEYLEIAGELEQRDPHYRAVLSTRKHAVEGLDITVQPGGTDAQSLAIADAVMRDIVNHAGMMDLRKNMLDALGKALSVHEIDWDTSGPVWKPRGFRFCDPRWFAFDKQSGALCLRDATGQGLTPVLPYKFIIHQPNLISGARIAGGLAFTALFYWLIKSYDVTSWAAFVDRFGYPVRIGKYGRKATKDDIATLKRAVAAIGSDIGAVIPDSMILDIIESKTTSANAAVYQSLAEWADKQLSKLVLGQTATTEGTPGKLGGEDAQRDVQETYVRADAAQAEQTLNRDLVIPYVNFNFGAQATYPRLVIQFVASKNVALIVDSVSKLVPLGLKIKAAEVRDILGFSAPHDDDDVLSAPSYAAMNAAMNAARRPDIALNAAQPAPHEAAIDSILSDAQDTDYVEISDDIAQVIEKAADRASDFTSFEKELATLIVDWPADKAARLMAIAFFKARAHGDTEFSRDD